MKNGELHLCPKCGSDDTSLKSSKVYSRSFAEGVSLFFRCHVCQRGFVKLLILRVSIEQPKAGESGT